MLPFRREVNVFSPRNTACLSDIGNQTGLEATIKIEISYACWQHWSAKRSCSPSLLVHEWKVNFVADAWQPARGCFSWWPLEYIQPRHTCYKLQTYAVHPILEIFLWLPYPLSRIDLTHLGRKGVDPCQHYSCKLLSILLMVCGVDCAIPAFSTYLPTSTSRPSTHKSDFATGCTHPCHSN